MCSSALLRPVVTYNSHKCQMFPIPGHFYQGERCVLTGDEESGVVIYDTLTGAVTDRINMDSGVIRTVAVEQWSTDFFIVLEKRHRFGLMSTSGEECVLDPPTAEFLQEDRIKRAMQKATWMHNERIFLALRQVGVNTIGFGTLLDVLQHYAETNPACREVIRSVRSTQINELFERTLQEEQPPPSPPLSLPPHFPTPPRIQTSQRCRGGVGLAPPIFSEKSSSSR